jgi:hypothetical protein
MKRQTQKPINPNRELYKKYQNLQLTLEEVLDQFKDYDIYGVVKNTSIYIVDNEAILIEFDSIENDDEDCIPTIYESYPVPTGYPFSRIVNGLREDGEYPTKLN